MAIFDKSIATKPTILLADDDRMTCILLSQKLTENHYDVTVVQNGLDALDMARHNNYDYIVTDIMMPGVEGIEVISEIIEKYPETKIVAISSDGLAGHSTLLTLAQTVGASAALQKPVRPTTLIETLQSI